MRQNAKEILEYSVGEVRVEYYIVLGMYEHRHLESDVIDVIYEHNVIYERRAHVDVRKVVPIRINVDLENMLEHVLEKLFDHVLVVVVNIDPINVDDVNVDR